MSAKAPLTEEQRKARRAANYKWRKANPGIRQEQTERNYAKGGNSRNKWQLWTDEENERVIAHNILDRELAWQLGRSVRSVHVQRNKLRKLFPERFVVEVNLSVEHHRFSGEKLRTWREQRGFTQADCERWIGVKRNRMSEWETGFRMPDATNILRLCILLDINARDLSGATLT